MYYPTKLHKEYIDYMITSCNNNGLSLLLEGSLAKNLGQKFSDIDLAISGNIISTLLESIISNYDSIVMTNYTENPKGIWILNYGNGINVDLDIRETFLENEINENIILCDNGFIFGNVAKRKDITSDMFPDRPQWYKILRLIHRCCIKYLCNKEENAKGLCIEVREAILNLYHIEIKNDCIPNQMREALMLINKKENMEIVIMDLFKKLISNM